MKLTKNPPAPMVKVKEDIDRLFDRFFTPTFYNEPFLPHFEASFETKWIPAFDLAETDKEFVVRLEVPGVHKENLDINLSGNVLTITGKREAVQEASGEAYLWKEREYGKFVRTLRLPSAVAENKVEAMYQDGVLVVHLPKVTPTPANKILIK
ncbi:MAG: Hsp20/alpha crystallin family protein [Gemmatimonadales bacterium]